MEVKFNTFAFLNVSCRSYFNDDLDNGVEVSLKGDYVGKIVGVDLVEDEDSEEFVEFVYEVEQWLFENS